MEMNSRPIGVLDSGVGGISVLRELVRLMPGEDFLYFGDSANAPYGTKAAQRVIELTLKSTDFLLEHGAKAIVVACNTATSVAINKLRELHSDIPVIGIEPALKPAVTAKEHSKVLVMATPMTLEQQKFNDMMHYYETDADIIKVPCPGLVTLIEKGILDGPEMIGYLEERFAPYREKGVDAVVLGCTHYPLIRDVVRRVLPDTVAIYDGGFGTARETRRRLETAGFLNDRTKGGQVTFFNSKDTKEMLELSEMLLHLQ